MLSVSSEPSSSEVLARDWAVPRAAPAFIGCSEDGRGPGGTVLLCVANSSIPCTLEARGKQRVVVFTVLNVREKGWLKAPWYDWLFQYLCWCHATNQCIQEEVLGEPQVGDQAAA